MLVSDFRETTGGGIWELSIVYNFSVDLKVLQNKECVNKSLAVFSCDVVIDYL